MHIRQVTPTEHPLPLPTGIGENLESEGIDSTSQSFCAGKLRLFYNSWKWLGAPPHILKIVSEYLIPFYKKPPLFKPAVLQQTPYSPEASKIIDQMIDQGVLEEANCRPSFISKLFLRPKPDGTARPIFNLKNLNKFVFAGKFRLVNIHRVPDFLQSNDWMTKIDFHQAYFHVPVVKSHRRFLRLIYSNKLLEMTCLPFGLSSAPKTFASLTNWVAQSLRDRGVRILVYLDDFFLVNQKPATLRHHIAITLDLLKYLGWIINIKKSVLTPQRTQEFLGIIWNPWTNQKFLPERLAAKLESQTRNMLAKEKATLVELQTIIGSMNFASFVTQRGRLHYRALRAQANKMLRQPVAKVYLTARMRYELIWWQRNCRQCSQIHFPFPTHYLTTDASNLGWGAKLDNQSLQGTWSDMQQNLYCNQKEMIAIIIRVTPYAPSLF